MTSIFENITTYSGINELELIDFDSEFPVSSECIILGINRGKNKTRNNPNMVIICEIVFFCE
ncbi:MAG: hypothetical protein RIF34_06555, partial [Candidatus Kapaibacterium sp.]